MHPYLFLAVTHLWQPLTEFARGGGGGSGGGGGGGGSIIAAIGYLPAHFSTQWTYQHSSKRNALIIGIIVALLVTVPCMMLSGSFGFIVGIGAVIGVYSGLHNWLGRIKGRMKSGKQSLDFAARTDPAWDQTELMDRISRMYFDYQKDWSDFNLEHIRTYTSPEYGMHACLMLTALYQMGRQNIVGEPKLLHHDVVDVIDQSNNNQDRFSAYIEGKAHDQLVDRTTGKVLYTDDSKFEELWWFDRDGNDWKLMRIDQATADGMQRDTRIEQFAHDNGMYYSLDWGWLLLPQRGQLFSKATFKGSDVNNHVIGMWNRNIIQLYTYIPQKNSRNGSNYLIAQLTLPKSYGGIVIKQKESGEISWLTHDRPRGYQKVTMEWPDFNERYRVYATDMDKVTSFELLNPKFMADLYDKNLGVNIEVVDNVVYLYTSQSLAVLRYDAMLDVLQAAYKELRM